MGTEIFTLDNALWIPVITFALSMMISKETKSKIHPTGEPYQEKYINSRREFWSVIIKFFSVIWFVGLLMIIKL